MASHYKKYIRIPPGESVDIRPILPIVHHPLFQRLLHVYQLSTTFFVFPGATHTRFEHALGVYSKSKRLAARLGSPVRIDYGARGGGKVTVRFGSVDDLERIYRTLLG